MSAPLSPYALRILARLALEIRENQPDASMERWLDLAWQSSTVSAIVPLGCSEAAHEALVEFFPRQDLPDIIECYRKNMFRD